MPVCGRNLPFIKQQKKVSRQFSTRRVLAARNTYEVYGMFFILFVCVCVCSPLHVEWKSVCEVRIYYCGIDITDYVKAEQGDVCVTKNWIGQFV